MTDEEVLDMAEKLGDMRDRGWSMTQLADELGYTNPSTLYTAKRELRGIEIQRYRKLCRLHADSIQPPASRRPRNGRKPSIPEARVDRFLELVEGLRRKGITQDEQARVAGYGSGAGFRMAIRARRVPVEVHDRIVELAAENRLVSKPVALQALPERNTRASWGAADYFKALATTLDNCAGLMEEAARDLANPLTRPGYERFVARLRELNEEVRAVVG